VRAGEASGDLAGTLARLADHLDAALARRRRLVRGAHSIPPS
jgi:type II secretory pathway component PulF